MATNKNQHFVPRCYLCPFTKDAEGVAINLYNVDRGKFIQAAPVKSQCSGDYFYGKDEKLEKAIQTVEGEYAKVLRACLTPGFRLTEEYSGVFKLFWLLQYMRTDAAARRAGASSAAMVNLIGEEGAEFRLQIKEAVQIAMRAFADQMHVIDDIRLCLVRNTTSVPFVTSDDPAVLTNRWNLSDPRRASLSFGLSAAGILTLLPLSPNVLCLGYDGDMYSVAQKDGWLSLRRESDVDAFNQHQFLNCRANIFAREAEHESYVREAFGRAASHRIAKRYVLHYAVLDRADAQSKRYKVVETPDPMAEDALLHLQVRYPVPTFWPSAISWHPVGNFYTNGTGTGYVRRAVALRERDSGYKRVRAL